MNNLNKKLLLALLFATTLLSPAFAMKRGLDGSGGESPNKRQATEQKGIFERVRSYLSGFFSNTNGEKINPKLIQKNPAIFEVLSKLSFNELLAVTSTCRQARLLLPQALVNFILNPNNQTKEVEIRKALRIFTNLVQNGIALPHDTYAIIQGRINNPEIFRLLIVLIQQKYEPALHATITAAKTNINNPNYLKKLLKELLDVTSKGQDLLPNLIEIPIILQNSTNLFVKTQALMMLTNLIQKSEALPQAILPQTIDIIAQGNINKPEIFKLLIALIQKRLEPAFNAATVASNANIDNPNCSLKLLIELIKHGHRPAFEIALIAVTKNIRNADSYIKDLSLKLLIKLVQQRHAPAFRVALIAAQANINNLNILIKNQALELFIKLVQEKHTPAFRNALSAAQTNINDLNVLIKNQALELFTELIQAGEKLAFSAALAAARNNFNIPSSKNKATELFYALMKFKLYDLTSPVTLYRVLNISHDATTKEIATAYREAAKKYHPDKNPKDESAKYNALFQFITHVKDLLSNEGKRFNYNSFLLTGYGNKNDYNIPSEYLDYF